MFDNQSLQNVLFHLEGEGTLKLPYGCCPLFDEDETINEAVWTACRWNPPQGHDADGPDPEASKRPLWSLLTRTKREMAVWPVLLEIGLNRACESAIVAAYGARDRQHETQKRLGGQTTPEQDAERVRLIARCHAIEAEIAAAGTLEKREVILAKINDGTWANEPAS